MRSPGHGYSLGQPECPGAEIWHEDIGACMCPPGFVAGELVGDCRPLVVSSTAGAVGTAGNTLATIAGVALGVGVAWLLWRKLR